MENEQQLPLEEIFGSYMPWKLDEVTWCISFMGGTQYIYLLEGEDKALLLDTGYGVGHLRALVETLTDRPVLVANTHFHPDHAAGNGEWEEVLVARGWEVDAPSVFQSGFSPCDLNTLPHPDYGKRVLRDGDRIALGGREVLVLEAKPAHCNSSLFFVDEGHRMLFCGDEFEAAQTMMFDNSQNPDAPYEVRERLDNLRENALRLRGLCREGWYLLPNHNGTPISPAYLDGYVRLVDGIYDGTAAVEDRLNHRYLEMDPKAPELCRVRLGRSSIIIQKAELMKVYGGGR